MRRLRVSALVASIALPHSSAAQQLPADLDRFLRESIRLDAAQLDAIRRGDAVAKVLETSDPRDVAIFGIATIPMSRAALLDRLLDLSRAPTRGARARFGIFSDPATIADVAALAVDEADLDDLRACRPMDCDFKLPASTMRDIQTRLAGSRAQQLASVSAYARERLVGYVNDYRARGDSALVVYDDRASVRASDAFAALLGDSPYFFKHVPALTRFFSEYPRARLPGAREAIYWIEDQPPRLRKTLTLVHRVVHTPAELPDVTLIATKQLYANHYFEGALDVSAIIARPAAGTAAGSSYYVAIRRYRFDNLPGRLNVRGRVIDALRDDFFARVPTR